MALTNVQKKQLNMHFDELVIGRVDQDTLDAYRDALGINDAAALAAIADYKTRTLPQLEAELAAHTARKQETQKKINLLNS